MNCTGGKCPIKSTCKRFTHPQGTEFYKAPPFWNEECNFHLRDETHEEYLEARNEALRETFKEQCGLSR